ncbi:FecR family protein [Pedobacter boryungensis]|uniref:FecR family protein n=1 Tax=Pedobacter boryungensis TaxID=869962 RepID=A0ABX2DAH2_9SPHI|nr:FecR family protein [Pedobacter boryungensis]NQX31055.1 FecR family protein [Pedobacter boryungensis]
MKKDKFLFLLSKKLSNDIAAEENELLTIAINNSEEYKQLADKLTKYFNQRKVKNSKTDKLRTTWAMIAKAGADDFEETFDYSPPKRKLNTALFLKIASVFILAIASTFLIYRLQNRTEQEIETISTGTTKSFKLLADGTKIWLNKNSALQYNSAFGKEKREITLKGEAYFDVVKNSSIPLFIHAGNITIEVKGTAFNVNAYSDKPNIEVALIRGLIQVSHTSDSENMVLLKPNQKLIIPNASANGAHSKFIIEPINSLALLNETKWTSDTLIFKKEKLKDLALQLEKKYELKIEIQSAQLKERRFSGTFTTETIKQVLEALKLSYPLTYTISNKLVIIKD